MWSRDLINCGYIFGIQGMLTSAFSRNYGKELSDGRKAEGGAFCGELPHYFGLLSPQLTQIEPSRIGSRFDFFGCGGYKPE
jgi:hypothetical protein